MTPLAKILIASTVLAILPLQAFAGANNGGPQHQQPTPQAGSVILNGQLSLGAQWSTVNTKVDGVAGDAVIQGSAGGNSVEIVTFDDTHVTNYQEDNSSNIGSDVTAKVANVDGGVSISSQAFCNSTDVSTDPNVTAVNSNQVCHASDPGATVNATVNNIGGDVSIASSASGNVYTEDTNALSSPTHLNQSNTSNVFSTVNTTVHNVGGSVGVTSSAVGNSAQIVHYSTDGASTTGQ